MAKIFCCFTIFKKRDLFGIRKKKINFVPLLLGFICLAVSCMIWCSKIRDSFCQKKSSLSLEQEGRVTFATNKKVPQLSVIMINVKDVFTENVVEGRIWFLSLKRSIRIISTTAKCTHHSPSLLQCNAENREICRIQKNFITN